MQITSTERVADTLPLRTNAARSHRFALVVDGRDYVHVSWLDRPIPFSAEKNAETPTISPALEELFNKPVSQEPLVDARDLGILGENYYFRTDRHNAPYHTQIEGSIEGLLLRKSVAEKLVVADRIARSHGMRIHLYDGLRTQATQKGLFHFFVREYLAKNPTATEQEANAHALQYASNPNVDVDDPRKAPLHTTGAAADVFLHDAVTGEPLEMGAAFDHAGPESHTAHYEQDSTSNEAALHNRRFLVNAMHAGGLSKYPSPGFSNYEMEFWHYNDLNRMGADAHIAAGRSFTPDDRIYGYTEPPASATRQQLRTG